MIDDRIHYLAPASGNTFSNVSSENMTYHSFSIANKNDKHPTIL